MLNGKLTEVEKVQEWLAEKKLLLALTQVKIALAEDWLVQHTITKLVKDKYQRTKKFPKTNRRRKKK